MRDLLNKIKNWDYRGIICCPVLFLMLVACEEAPRKQMKEYEGPTEEIRNIHMLLWESQNLKIELKTPRQLSYTNGDKVFPDTININFYNEIGELSTTLRADSGRYDRIKNLYTVKGKTVADMLTQGETLYTSELTWDPRQKIIYNDKTVRNNTRKKTGERLNGFGMRAQQDFSGFSLLQVYDSPRRFSNDEVSSSGTPPTPSQPL